MIPDGDLVLQDVGEAVGAGRVARDSSGVCLGDADNNDGPDPADRSEMVATLLGWGVSVFDHDFNGDLDVVFHVGLDMASFLDAPKLGVVLNNRSAPPCSSGTGTLCRVSVARAPSRACR